MQVKVVLIYLPHPYLFRPESHAPLGILYIAATLEQNGYDVEIKNYTALNTEEALEDVPEADLYGITVTSLELLQANRFSAEIKKKYTKAVVGLGGPGVFTDSYVDFNHVDFICKGDGEETIFDIIKDIESDHLSKCYTGKTIDDLDSLPFPSRHLLPTSQGGAIFAYNYDYKEYGSTQVATSRGCPFKCSFCAAPFFTSVNGGIRYRSPKSVFDEIQHIIDNYGIRQYKFCDEIFTINKKRVFEICDLIGGLDIAWKASARTKPFDYEIAKAMEQAGCKEIAFGVESFDDDVLKALNKGTTAVDNANALECAAKAGLKSRVLFMIRTPGQTSRTASINIEWLKKVPYHLIACTSFVPIPGSDTWANPDKYNIEILNKNLDDYNFYFYGVGDDRENNMTDIIKIKDRSLDELNKESLEFREYLNTTGKINVG